MNTVLCLFINLVGFYCLSNIVTAIDVENDLCQCSKISCSCQGLRIHNVSSQIAPLYCSSKITQLSLVKTNINQLDSEAFMTGQCDTLLSLTIRESKIRKFNATDFAGLVRVTKLNIGGNNLSTYAESMFAPMSQSLVILTADRNRARSLIKKTFAKLVNLEIINLSHNKIGYIQNGTFSDCKKLRKLYLDYNILTDIDSDAFYGLGELEHLDLRRNPFMKISKDSFKSMPRLKTLLISHQDSFQFGGVSELEDHTFFTLSKLRTLSITELRITNLRPLTFYGLSDLENLSLKSNRLPNISRSVFNQLQGLHTLDLSNNRLRCLMPDNFADLSYLKELDLSGNYLTYISDMAFGDLTFLKVLRLDSNPFHVIQPNALCGLRSLRVLHFSVSHKGISQNFIGSKYAKSPFAKLSRNATVYGLSSTPYQGLQTSCQQQKEDPTVERDPLYCPVHDPHWLDEQIDEPTGSRMYLLIIVGICIGFLLVAFTVIMSYRAWSKQKMMNCDLDELAVEKQEMIQRNQNGRPASTAETGPLFYATNGNGSGSALVNQHNVKKASTPPNGIIPTSIGYQPAPLVQQQPGTGTGEEEATLTTFGIV